MSGFKLALIIALLVSIVTTESAKTKAKPKKGSRIVGGTATTISAVPYLVNLRVGGTFRCGGTLINQNVVVTAAHCVRGVSPKSVTVYGGSTTISGGGVKRSVSKIIVHKRFNYATLRNDVAVLRLSQPMTGTNIKPIQLATSAPKAGTTIKVSGWGLMRASAATIPDIVQTVNVPVISKKRCARSYRGYGKVTGSMFCASVPGRKDACSGDSGGPAICNNRLCGIVSWGIGCASRKFPGVYTNVKAVRKFIRSSMA